MSILENAAEIDRLCALREEAEKAEARADAVVKQATRDAEMNAGRVKLAELRIETLYDGIASSIPSNSDECLALAVILRGLTADGVFLQDETKTRERADRIVDNLVVGLNRLSSADSFPAWMEENIREAETGTTAGFRPA